jgi:hypothetical protein
LFHIFTLKQLFFNWKTANIIKARPDQMKKKKEEEAGSPFIYKLQQYWWD